MIELRTTDDFSNDRLEFSFPEVHPDAKFSVDFQRTFRIPDDDNEYPLPPGFGNFPLRHVDDYADTIPKKWAPHGGVMLPMYQSEALWLNFDSYEYPFAVKVAAGKINAVTGEEWKEGIHRDPQDYLVLPEQPWLDGFCVEEGLIRQFVAMPLGSGYSAEEQITGRAEVGGLQISAYPMKAEAYERMRLLRDASLGISYDRCCSEVSNMAEDMSLSPGGKMRQHIYEDEFDFADWDTRHCSRCFIHIANSLVWETITGEQPPTVPPTARMYEKAGLPWFEYYQEEAKAVKGARRLKKLKSIATLGKEIDDNPLPENESVTPENVIGLAGSNPKSQVREGDF